MSECQPGTSRGARVFSESGEEIDNISRIEIVLDARSFPVARIDVMISSDSDIQAVLAQLGHDTLKSIAESQGYKLIPQDINPAGH